MRAHCLPDNKGLMGGKMIETLEAKLCMPSAVRLNPGIMDVVFDRAHSAVSRSRRVVLSPFKRDGEGGVRRA